MSNEGDVLQSISALELPIMPVIKVSQADDIIPVAETLIEGGINALEITLRTEAGLDAIEVAKKRFPDAFVCAGTVTEPIHIQQVKDRGVDLCLTPGATPQLLETAVSLGVDVIPGVATASEVMLAQSFGLKACKLFPASIVGGIGMLKALSGPFPDVKFCPTGGVNVDNFQSYLALDNVFCIGGTWMMISTAGQFDREKSAIEVKKIRQALRG